MKKKLYIYIVGIIASTTMLTHANLIITEVMSNSDHPGGAGNGDWFELYNNGTMAIDLSSYSWDDDSNTPGSQTFGSITLNAGEYLVVVDENAGNIGDWQGMWNITAGTQVIDSSNGFAGFGASGDTLFIYDDTDALVTSVVLGDSDGGGKSFEYAQDGSPLDFAVAGENGAYVALNDGSGGAGVDIASPGFAVIPEPGTLGLFGLGIITLLARRKRG